MQRGKEGEGEVEGHPLKAALGGCRHSDPGRRRSGCFRCQSCFQVETLCALPAACVNDLCHYRSCAFAAAAAAVAAVLKELQIRHNPRASPIGLPAERLSAWNGAPEHPWLMRPRPLPVKDLRGDGLTEVASVLSRRHHRLPIQYQQTCHY